MTYAPPTIEIVYIIQTYPHYTTKRIIGAEARYISQLTPAYHSKFRYSFSLYESPRIKANLAIYCYILKYFNPVYACITTKLN